MEGSILVHELRKVITLVDLLRDIGLDKQLSLPKVAVLGNQSSGKSSLLEQIVGIDFLPRGSGVVTRRPLELRMNNIPNLKNPYAEFDEVLQGGKKKRFTNFAEVKKTIEDVTDKVCGSKKIIKDIPIILNIFSSSCPNLTIVDLPGITSIPVGEQPKNIYEITRDMALRYINQKRSIILCVIPANQDLSTSEALKVMREVDKRGERSIGCLTKIDIMNRGDDASKILKNLQIPLKYGYVGIKNRCQEDVLNNVPVSESLRMEREFFTKSPIYSTLPPDTFGTESLTKKLTGILYQQIKSSMPEIFEQIKKKKADAQEELEKLGPGVASTDGEMVNYAWKSISTFMRIFLNSISGIKSSDYSGDPLTGEIHEELSNLYRDQYDQPATSEISDKQIQKAMINFPGDSTIPGFPSIDAFLALLNPLLKKLQNPAYSINNRIHELMEHEAMKIINQVMIKKFPQFNDRFTDLIRKVLERHRRQLQNYLNFLLDSEISYLYTNDASYLMGDFALTDKEKKKLDSGKIKDPLIFQLRKRIDSYYKLVVRNLRDLIPKQIFNFLITKCLKQMEFEAFQFTSDVNKLKQLLNEPQQVRIRRRECVKAIKVFEESEKRIRMDPEISKLVRNSQRESKYYKKFGMKTPEEQEEIIEKQQMERMIKIEKESTIKRRPPPPQPPRNKSRSPPPSQQQNHQRQPSNTSTNTSTSKNEASSGSQSQNTSGKDKGNIFSMFGTSNVNNPPPPTQPKDMRKGGVGTGVTSPPPPPPPPQEKKPERNFADVWSETTTKQEVAKNNGPTTVPKPVEQKKEQKKEERKRTTTFNNLFGLSNNK